MALGVTPQASFDYLARGLLVGQSTRQGQSWQIDLSDEQIDRLRAQVQRMRRSRKDASRKTRLAEDVAPLGEASVRGEDHRALFVAGVDELEEQIAVAATQRSLMLHCPGAPTMQLRTLAS